MQVVGQCQEHQSDKQKLLCAGHVTQLTGAIKSHGHSYSVAETWGVLSYIAQWCAAPTFPKSV